MENNQSPLSTKDYHINLSGKVALVTGGARGIGWGIAEALAGAGANVVIADKDISGMEEILLHARSRYAVDIQACQVDVSDSNALKKLFDCIESVHQHVDILVNNAGIYPLADVLAITDDDYDQVISLNQRAVFIASRTFAQAAVARKAPGVIINITGSASVKTTGNSAHYIMSKHAVMGLTKTFARDLGPHGIRVVAVAPSLTDTPGIAAIREIPAVDQGMKHYADSLPLARIGTTEDVAKVVLFVASDLAAYVTGSTIFVDGGEFSM